jgi:uncharacterized lipoprotein YbaY
MAITRLFGHLLLAPLLLAAPPLAPAEAVTRIANSGLYICPDGTLLRFDRRAYGPFLLRDGRELQLHKRWAFNGFRYVADGGIEIRGRGIEGEKVVRFSERAKIDLDCPAAPAAATPGIVTGTVSASSGLEIPQGSRLLVNLRDTARADTAAPLLAQVEFNMERPLPLAFMMRYPPARIAPPAVPTLSARLLDARGRLIAVSDTVIPLPPPDGSRNRLVDIPIRPAAPAPPNR